MAFSVQKSVEFLIKDSYQELKKVVWPTRKEVIQHTMIVIIFSISIALFLGALDFLFALGIQKIISK